LVQLPIRNRGREAYDKWVRKLSLIGIPLLVLLLIAFLLAQSASPVVDLSTPVTALGQTTSITVHVRNPHGIRRLAAFVEQNGVRYRVGETAQPLRLDGTWSFTAGTSAVPQLKDGKAQLIVEATSNDFLRKTTRLEREVMVVTQPPAISVDSDQHYLYLGMAELATFNLSGNWTEAGVRVGDQTFRAWPMPGGKPGYFSLFAFAWNMQPGTAPLVYASNGTGNQVTGPMVFQFPKKEQPRYTVQ
jgi:hypothetical protein